MLTFSDVQTFLSAALTAKGYGTAGHPAMPTFNPGPPTIKVLQNISPNSIVFLTVGNGIGLAKEGLYDRPFIVARVLGTQRDYGMAETLAHDIDAIFNAVETKMVGNTRTLYITRNAPPQLVDYDAADRYHFQTSYIAESMV